MDGINVSVQNFAYRDRRLREAGGGEWLKRYMTPKVGLLVRIARFTIMTISHLN